MVTDVETGEQVKVDERCGMKTLRPDCIPYDGIKCCIDVPAILCEIDEVTGEKADPNCVDYPGVQCWKSIWDRHYSLPEKIGIYTVIVVLILSIIIFICACVIDCLERYGIQC